MGRRPAGTGLGATKSWRPSSTPRWGAVPPRRAGPCPSTWMSCRPCSKPASGEEGGRIDLETGEVWPASTIEYFAEQEPEQAPDLEDPDRWLYVGPEGSDEGYRDMEDFIGRVDNPEGPTDRLGIAIDGRGAFRRFKDTISRWPDDQERWYRFSDERRRGRARQWLSFAGYRVAPKGPETATRSQTLGPSSSPESPDPGRHSAPATVPADRSGTEHRTPIIAASPTRWPVSF